MVFILLILILLAWLIISAFLIKGKQGFDRNSSPTQSSKKLPMGLSAKSYYINWQENQLHRHQLLLYKALKEGNSSWVKIHRSMIVFIRSLITIFAGEEDVKNQKQN